MIDEGWIKLAVIRGDGRFCGVRRFFILGRFFYCGPAFLFGIVDPDFALLVPSITRRIGIVDHSILVHVFIDLGRDLGMKC